MPIRGVTYVVTGGGGRGTRPVGESSFTAFSLDVLDFVPGPPAQAKKGRTGAAPM